MEWTEAIREAVSYIEKYITEDITMYDVADHVHISPFYFHKGFGILCGYILTTRITMRRYGFQSERKNEKRDRISKGERETWRHMHSVQSDIA